MVKRVFFGAVTNSHVEELKDLNSREYFLMVVLSVCVIGMPRRDEQSNRSLVEYPQTSQDRPSSTSSKHLNHYLI
jgi:hypothetical protein